jgi:hypothetical protein
MSKTGGFKARRKAVWLRVAALRAETHRARVIH